MPLPDRIEDLEQLEELLSRPSDALVQTLERVEGDILVLGVGGKMGPTLARMAKRASPGRQVIGVARFSEPGLRERLQAQGIRCIEADLLSREALAALPEAPNVVFMAGRKFGSSGSEWLTWAMNAHAPALVAERFRRSRIVAFSTACVYPFTDARGPGAREDVLPTPPPGEYANSCVARERLFEHFSHLHGTPGRLIRLSYAIDMRYGVLHDLAQKLMARQPIDLAMGHANIIWQGEANDWTLRSLAHCDTPTSPLNLSGPAIAIREAAEGLAQRLGVEAVFTGREADTAWLIDCSRAFELFGPQQVTLARMMDWTADWVRRGMASLNKPTHFEARDGKY
ncbi:NAD(P)-dependent oxidoreductase [Variovorax guangxiensis]|uniref:NAD-dependent epimerase/dehydratase family protein n=1 Tax=Variovorax guangxiensis TaxID=1775474 RepID=UPI002862B899|nr:NAD(P)-dependent oxidoreductase [Variovorax guangxiensis]MDR6859683.1 nucleoside-diphosphate-sugar epimerase [Variovorax guangxiensis]